jgi:UDP-N-acetyl-D-glucosamine/UDP-N-acetyl-D-galactosamine dehydrogenase
MSLGKFEITIVGLGYVGLPLAVEFGKKYTTNGFDVDIARIAELKEGYDKTKELSKNQIKEANKLRFSSTLIGNENLRVIYIVTVPTPIDINKKPDLKPLLSASELIGKALKKGDIVIYESTVYPGCTEEDCVPILEAESRLKFNQDFFCGYSPERINLGDKVNTLKKIKKVTSGSNPEIADFVDELYNTIITAGTHKASSIKVAEASKIIENCQRDINISFMNELAMLFDKLDLDINEVLEASKTKWNFLDFKPGLVGGHCIGIDPYYLIHKAESVGFDPSVIGSGRRVNEQMPIFIANKIVKNLLLRNIEIKGAKVLILGITYKVNCADIRNSRVVDLYKELLGFGIEVDIYDPLADKKEVFHQYRVNLLDNIENKYDLVYEAVGHDVFDVIEFLKNKKAN